MNKNLIKNVALNMRKYLIEGIAEKARILNLKTNSLEDIAYTWFIRLIAIRFMEVNKYIHWEMEDMLSSKVDFIKLCNYLSEIMPSVFDRLDEDMHLLLPDNIFEKKSAIIDLIGSIDESYWKVEPDEEERFHSRNIDKEKVDERIKAEEGGVEIIGWLYQYFFSVKKEEIFSDLKKNKLTKNNLSIATQIFTPKWIVKYMVENSLGRLWLELNFNERLLSKWKYLICNEDENTMQRKEKVKLKYKNLSPEEIKVLDPAMGSGNILSYAFDILYDIYLACGYEEEKIPFFIIEKNLYGLDIDDRVSKLAIFTILMKARSKNPNILEASPKINLISIQESKVISDRVKKCLESIIEPRLKNLFNSHEIQYLIHIFQDAKEYGALLYLKNINFDKLEKRVESIYNAYRNELSEFFHIEFLLENIRLLIKQGRIMSQKYDVVLANPPYSGIRKFNKTLKKFVEENYNDYKYDLFSIFIVRNLDFTKDDGFASFMTPNVWQFISSYENLRNYIIDNYQILSLVQLAEDDFKDASIAISTFIIKKSSPYTKSTFIKLNHRHKVEDQGAKYKFDRGERFYLDQKLFKKIIGSRIAFWIGDNSIKTFERGKFLGDLCKPRQGMATSDNHRFLRYWYEERFDYICFSNQDSNIGNYKWVPYNKGGGYRKWYGNNLYIINWENNGYEVKEYAKKLYGNYTRTIKNEDFYFREGITYAFIGKDLSPRYSPGGVIFDVAGSMIFVPKEKLFYILGLLASKLSKHYTEIINPSLNKQVGDIKNIPLIESTDSTILENINQLVKENILISKTDWDSFEISWDFKKHPILTYKGRECTIEGAYHNWASFTRVQFNRLKENEEMLNRLFIHIYGLDHELTPEVDCRSITIRRALKEREIKSLISYAVGCMFGRYSLDVDGLIYAGGNFSQAFKLHNNQWYINTGREWRESSIDIVEDNMIPVTGDGPVEGDILSRFINFIKKAFGEASLEANLNYIAKALGSKKGESARKFLNRYFYHDFIKDHLHIYKKRPIYLLISKENGCKFLVYKHRCPEFNMEKKE